MSGGGNQPATKVVFIKKKAKGHGHHGGAWKVAYADFVTAMMALFIVLWLLTQTDQSSRERIAEYFRTGSLPGGSMVIGKPGGSNPPVAVDLFPYAVPAATVEGRKLDKLAKAIDDLLNAEETKKELGDLKEHVTVDVVDEGVLIELVDGGDSFMFPLGSAELKPEAVAILQRLTVLLMKMPNNVEIHGHTDARPYDKDRKMTNWQLSFERADKARAVLESAGIPKGKIVGVQAHADTQLFNTKDPYSPENRRLSVLVVRSAFDRIIRGDPRPDTGLFDDHGEPKPEGADGASQGAHDEHGAAPHEGAKGEHGDAHAPAEDGAGHAPNEHGAAGDKPAPEDAHAGEHGSKEPGHDGH